MHVFVLCAFHEFLTFQHLTKKLIYAMYNGNKKMKLSLNLVLFTYFSLNTFTCFVGCIARMDSLHH